MVAPTPDFSELLRAMALKHMTITSAGALQIVKLLAAMSARRRLLAGALHLRHAGPVYGPRQGSPILQMDWELADCTKTNANTIRRCSCGVYK
jgi:hypothetical protein